MLCKYTVEKGWRKQVEEKREKQVNKSEVLAVLRDQDYNADVQDFRINVLRVLYDYKFVRSRNQEHPSMTSAVENEVLAQVIYFRVICF